MRSFFVLLVLLSACGPITPATKDAGSAGGQAGGAAGGQGGGAAGGQAGGASGGQGGGSAGGQAGGAAGGQAGGSAGGQAGGSAGGQAGGSAGGSSGGAAGGAIGPFIWSNLAVMPAPTLNTSAATVGARPGEAYVGFDNGRLYRSTGTAFQEVTGVVVAGLKDLYLSPTGKVFIVSSSRSAAHCLGPDCSLNANWVFLNSAAGVGTEAFLGTCGLGEQVYAIGTRDTNVGVLYEFDGMGAWTRVSNNLGISRPRRCELGPGGEVYVVGDLGVVRYEQGATTPEPVDTTGQPQASWEAIGLAIDNGVIVDAFIGGSGSGSRYARREAATSSWTGLMPVATGPAITVIAAVSPTEFLAAGAGTPKFTVWNGASFVAAMPGPPNTIGTVRDIAVATPREVFVVGSDGNSSYSIIRGRR